jgi:hypothetical protein
MRCCSAQADTVSCGGGRSMAPARRRTCSRVRLSFAAEAGRVEAIGGLRQNQFQAFLPRITDYCGSRPLAGKPQNAGARQQDCA